MRISAKRAKELGIASLPPVREVGNAKPNKFGAVSVKVNGESFPSKLEGRRYAYLYALQEAGEIHRLSTQPKFVLQPGFTDHQGRKHTQMVYTLDFEYWMNGRRILEEVKGRQTTDFKIRWKWFLQQVKSGKHGDTDVYLVTKEHTPPGTDTPKPQKRKRKAK